MGVKVDIAYDFAEQALAQLNEKLKKLIDVAKEVPAIVKGRAILDNEDVDGNQMAAKQPRPKAAPDNFPNIALIQDEEPDEMSNDRWEIDQISPLSVDVIFHPSDHHQYLESKPPEHGGRKWITKSELNPNARAEIVQRVQEIFNK